MNILIEPNFLAKLVSVKKINKEDNTLSDYDKPNFREKFIGKEGNLLFKYYSRSFEFKVVLNDDIFDYDFDRFFSSRIKHIEEKNGILTINTLNSIYVFEITHKSPNENTQDYYNYLMQNEKK